MDNGPDGASHHGNEDIALMRSLPNMRILVPQSPSELDEAVADAIRTPGPCYIRVSRDVVPVLTGVPAGQFGGVKCIRDHGLDFAIVYEGTAMMAAVRSFDLLEKLGQHGRLLQVQTIKPFPQEELLCLVKDVRKIVTVENHTIIGGLGSAVAEVLSGLECHPKLIRAGVPDVFTQSGSTVAVKARYGLDPQEIANAVIAE